MSEKKHPLDRLLNLNQALIPYGYHLSASEDIRYFSVDFNDYKMYHDVLVEI